MSFTFFVKTNTPFSQWHPSFFLIDGIDFSCAEEYMMLMKAKTFGDEQAAQRIRHLSAPWRQRSPLTWEDIVRCDLQAEWKDFCTALKQIGREVQGYDHIIWSDLARPLVFRGNFAKFTQNIHLRQALFATAGTVIVEAASYDKVWGIGLDADDPRAQDPAQWQGTNWLGEVLTTLRDGLMG